MIKDRTILFCLLLTMVGAVLFVVSYALGGDRLYEGLSLALAAAGLCGAFVGWAFWILPAEQVVDERSFVYAPSGRSAQDDTNASGRSAQDDRHIDAAGRAADAGTASITRNTLLTRMLYAALGFFGIAMVVPLRSLGPALGDSAWHTKWRKGMRLQREDGSFVRASDLNVNSVVTVFPEGDLGDAQAQTVLIRVPSLLSPTAEGFVAYSKVCTHAGCPVALYRAAAKQLMCPCHQSVFDVLDNGRVVSGPADHALPRLPIEVGADGYLRATGDFPSPVGPGFWERSS